VRKIVGYFDGTNPLLLTALVCNGHDTLPVSNGRDNHGQHVRLINNQNRFELLLGHVHKIFAPENHQPSDATYQDVFHVCGTYSIPLLLEVPAAMQPEARSLLGDPPEIVRLVDPADMLAAATAILAD